MTTTPTTDDTETSDTDNESGESGKVSRTYKLSAEARRLLNNLAKHHGLKHTQVIEYSLRQQARRDGVE